MPLHLLPFKKAKQKQHRGYPYLPHPHAAFSFVTDKALMRILHVPLINSLNPCTEPFLYRDMRFASLCMTHLSPRNVTRSVLYWSSLWLFGTEMWTCEETHLSASADLQNTCSALKHGEIDPAGLFTSSTHLGVLPRHLQVA